MKNKTLAAVLATIMTVQSFASIVSAGTVAEFSGNDGGSLFELGTVGVGPSRSDKEKTEINSNKKEENPKGISQKEKDLEKLEKEFNTSLEDLRAFTDARLKEINNDASLSEDERKLAIAELEKLTAEMEQDIKNSYNKGVSGINTKYTESERYSNENMKKQSEISKENCDINAAISAIQSYLDKTPVGKSVADDGISMTVDYGDYKVVVNSDGSSRLVGHNENGDYLDFNFEVNEKGTVVGVSSYSVSNSTSSSGYNSEGQGVSHSEGRSSTGSSTSLNVPGIDSSTSSSE